VIYRRLDVPPVLPLSALVQYATRPQTEDSQRREDVADLFKVSRNPLPAATVKSLGFCRCCILSLFLGMVGFTINL
jgi:hypothetical protein